jgi:TolB protein
MLVLDGPGDEWLDSVRVILRRDLDYGDAFELITLPPNDTMELGIGEGGSAGEYVNYGLYAALGADFTVRVRVADSTTVLLYDVRAEAVRRAMTVVIPAVRDEGFRFAVHRVADELVRAVTGQGGIAATRFLFLQRGRIYRIDADGADLQPVTAAGARAFSSAWAPDGRRIAYTEFHEQGAQLYVQEVGGGRRLVGTTERGLNYTPAFAPDGRTLVFSRSDESGTDIFSYDVERHCCLARLTSGRFADNLSPTFSPDGRRIAFVSTRAGAPQIYVMSADGTGQELLAPFDYGVTGSSNAPEWSPDGLSLAFHRDVGGSPQVFLLDVQRRDVRQLTSAGRNEDPTWAPDGRHLAFVSNRTGNRQIWVIDLETGRVRQVTRVGEARLPAWSGRMY